MEGTKPDQPVCTCTQENQFCSVCLQDPKRQKAMERLMSKRDDRLYRSGHGVPRIIREVKPVSSTKLDKKRRHHAKLLLQKALGKRLTNQQFDDYLKVRAEALRQKRHELATFGPDGPPKPPQTAEDKIANAVKNSLKDSK